jgi:hypothetical protein
MELLDRCLQAVKKHLPLSVAVLSLIGSAVRIVQVTRTTAVVEAALRMPGVLTLSTGWRMPYRECRECGIAAAKLHVNAVANKGPRRLKIVVPLSGDSVELELTLAFAAWLDCPVTGDCSTQSSTRRTRTLFE